MFRDYAGDPTGALLDTIDTGLCNNPGAQSETE